MIVPQMPKSGSDSLTKIIIDHLGEQFDREIIYSCAVSSQDEHSNMIYVHYQSS